VAVAPGITQRIALVDVVTGLLDKGAVISGQATVSLAGVELVYVALNLLVSSVETLRTSGGPTPGTPPRPPELDSSTEAPRTPRGTAAGSAPVSAGPSPRAPQLGQLLVAEPTFPVETPNEQSDQGLAGLVLALVELIRQLLERQAVRRMEGGALTEDEVERMGRALMELNAKMRELFAIFGLDEADVNLDLGPLGQIL